MEFLILLARFTPDVHDELSTCGFELDWIFGILFFGVDVNHDGFAKSSVADRAVDNELVNTWSQISCIDKHTFVFSFVIEVFEVLGCCVFHVDVSELIF